MRKDTMTTIRRNSEAVVEAEVKSIRATTIANQEGIMNTDFFAHQKLYIESFNFFRMGSPTYGYMADLIIFSMILV